MNSGGSIYSVSNKGATYSRSRCSQEDETTKIRSPLIRECSSSVDQSTDAITLEGGADEGGAPGDSGGGSLAGSEELLLGVGGLGALVGLAEERAEDG